VGCGMAARQGRRAATTAGGCAADAMLPGKPPIALHFSIKMSFAAARWPGMQYTSGF
jgi:hypothetical protein